MGVKHGMLGAKRDTYANAFVPFIPLINCPVCKQMVVVPQERALQGRISVAFGICKNALRMERQARQNVTAELATESGNAAQIMCCSCLHLLWLL